MSNAGLHGTSSGTSDEPRRDLSVGSLLAGAVTGLRNSEQTGILIGEENKILGANERGSALLHLPEIPVDGIDWVGMTPPEFRSGDERAISEASRYTVSRWFRKQFTLSDGDTAGIDLILVATGTNPFRWIAFLREAGSSPLPSTATSPPVAQLSPTEAAQAITLARRLAGAATSQQVMNAIDRLGTTALSCTYVNVAVAVEHTLRIHHDPSTEMAIQQRYTDVSLETSTLLGDAFRDDAVLIIDVDTFEATYPHLGTDGRAMGFTHFGAAPMHTDDGRIIGVLGLAWSDDREPSTIEHVQTIADIIANSLDLASDTERARSMATSFQDMLLPARLDRVVGARVEVRYRAVDRAVGGDFYDVVASADGSAWLVIGDVVGHGLAASRTMGKIRFFLRAVMRHGRDPADVLSQVHDLLLSEGMQELATCLIGRWDPVDSTLALASAGHLPPVLTGGDDGATSVVVEPSPPLGVPLGAFEPLTTTISVTGLTRLLFYTDGLIERRDEPIDVSITSLGARLDALARTRLDEASDSLVRNATSSGDDDMALLLIEFDPQIERQQPAHPSD